LPKTRIGFFGCGGIGSYHAERLKRLENVEIAGGTDTDSQRLKTFVDRFGGVPYRSLDEMLSAGRPDAVYATTPPFARGPEVAAIEKGIPVFFEKPVALTMSKAEELLRAVRSHGVVNSVGYMSRYMDLVDLAKEQISKGGPISMVQGEWIGSFHFPKGHWWVYKDKGGGQLIEQTTHAVDLARYLAGEANVVSAQIDNLVVNKFIDPDATAEDTSMVMLRFRSGAIGTITSSCVSQDSYAGWGVKVFAKDVVLDYSGSAKTLKVHRGNEVREVRSKMDPYFEEDRVFVEAVRTGNTDGIRSTFEDAARTLELTVAANGMSEKGHIVAQGTVER
jgi:predicted dehydrogenase